MVSTLSPEATARATLSSRSKCNVAWGARFVAFVMSSSGTPSNTKSGWKCATWISPSSPCSSNTSSTTFMKSLKTKKSGNSVGCTSRVVSISSAGVVLSRSNS